MLNLNYHSYTIFNRFILLLLITTFFSCQSDESLYKVVDGEIPEFQNSRNSDFDPYIDLFLSEAEKRGLNFNKDSIFIDYKENIETPGLCNSDNQVYIRPSDWSYYSECIREFLIFHELGHCTLNRHHKNNKINGRWVSLMRGKGSGFPDQSIENIRFYGLFKQYYIDECFDATTPIPDWFSGKLTIDSFAQNPNSIQHFDTINYSNTTLEIPSENYRIDLEIAVDFNHNPVTINGGGSVFVESIVLSDGNLDISIDLLNNRIKRLECSETVVQVTDAILKVSLIADNEKTYLFINDEFFSFYEQFSSPLVMKTELVDGIDLLKIYEF